MSNVLEQDDTVVSTQNAKFVFKDRREHNIQNAKAWNTMALELGNELRILVAQAYWSKTYAPNINKKAITIKVEKGLNAQVDIEHIAELKAFIEAYNVVERTRNGHRFFDIVK